MSKTIGVLTTHIGGAMRPYEKVFSLAVAKTAEKLGINLVFYSGGFYEMQTGFERLRNFVYDFVKYDKPDGLLVISSLLGNFIELEVMGSFSPGSTGFRGQRRGKDSRDPQHCC